MTKISCVICAYNEADRIGGVLQAVVNHPLVDEVIVVDDGSTDATALIVECYSTVRLIRHETNSGKSRALVTGIKAAQYETLALLDADLIGLTQDDVVSLIAPVLNGEADISMSIRKNSLLVYKLIGLDFVSGERMFTKSLVVNHLEEMSQLPSFGLEVFLNQIVIKNKMRVKTVPWERVIGPRKSDKMGLLRGTISDLKMIFDILKVVSLRDIVIQNYKILSLSV